MRPPVPRRPLFVKLTLEERAVIDRLAAAAAVAAGRPVTLSDLVRQLVKDADEKGKPIRVRT